MSEPTVDLFKFVSLRSPDEPDGGKLPLRFIHDPRVLNVSHYPLPVVDEDTKEFAGSAAAAAIRQAVSSAVVMLKSPADIPAANRGIAQHFAVQHLQPAEESRTRIAAF